MSKRFKSSSGPSEPKPDSPFLHSPECCNSKKDIKNMQQILLNDPKSLERKSTNNDNKVTPLVDAVAKDHEMCVQFLISAGANLNATDSFRGIVAVGIVNNSLQSLEYIFKNNILSPKFEHNGTYYRNLRSTNIFAKYLGSNYYLACSVLDLEENCTEMIDLFLKYGVDLNEYVLVDEKKQNTIMYSRYSPTIQAILISKPSVLKMLLLRGAMIDHKTSGWSLLGKHNKEALSLIHCFCKHDKCFGTAESLRILKLLHEFGTNLWEKGIYDYTPLSILELKAYNHESMRAANGNNYWFIQSQRQKYNPDVATMIIQTMKELMKTPLSLQKWCRIALVRQKKIEYPRYMEKMAKILPTPIVEFLRADELP